MSSLTAPVRFVRPVSPERSARHVSTLPISAPVALLVLHSMPTHPAHSVLTSFSKPHVCLASWPITQPIALDVHHSITP
jgi:hypothetical protein